MTKVKITKDIPVGVLILVLSQFVMYGAVYLANHPKWYEMFGIILCTLVSSDMITFGYRLIKGYEFDKSE